MEKLTIEEKAKRYDEAIEIARKIKNGEPINVPNGTVIPDVIFPELKETEEKPNGGIVLEDFNEGDGFYKVNLAYLSKEQVEEIESIVKKWNHKPSELDEKIRKEIIAFIKDMAIPDAWIAWLEKQGKQTSLQTNERAWLYLVSDVLTWKDGIGQYLDDPRVQELAKKSRSEYAQKLYNSVQDTPNEQKTIERKDFISIPFGTDSELIEETITIPDGCVATIEGNKIHIKRKGKSATEAIKEEKVDNANKVEPTADGLRF